MSFRPTISVYVKGRIADIGYYRNWDEKSLLYEAVATAMLYEDCRSPEEFRQRKFGRQRIRYIVEPETFENTEENLKWFEEHSELPILVDLTAKCIYASYGALPPGELEKIPVYREEILGHRQFSGQEIPGYETIDAGTDFSDMLYYSRIPFGEMDREEVIRCFTAWPRAGYHLSEGVMDQLRKYGKEAA